jgi:hypothetical protein
MAPHSSDVRTAIDINQPMTRATYSTGRYPLPVGSTRTWPVEKVRALLLVERIRSDLGSNCVLRYLIYVLVLVLPS